MTISSVTDAEIDAAIAAGKNEFNCPLATSAAYIVKGDPISVTPDDGIKVRFPRGSMRELANKTPEQISLVTHRGGANSISSIPSRT